MIKTLLDTLNNYSLYYSKTLNPNILPAIDRIKNAIEKQSGSKLKISIDKDGTAKYSL